MEAKKSQTFVKEVKFVTFILKSVFWLYFRNAIS